MLIECGTTDPCRGNEIGHPYRLISVLKHKLYKCIEDRTSGTSGPLVLNWL